MAEPVTDGPPQRIRGMSQTDWQLALYVDRWRRYLRRFARRLAPDAPIRKDMRYWEARRCSVDVGDLSAFLWFFGLNGINRYQLYTSARDLRRDALFDKRRPVRINGRSRSEFLILPLDGFTNWGEADATDLYDGSRYGKIVRKF